MQETVGEVAARQYSRNGIRCAMRKNRGDWKNEAAVSKRNKIKKRYKGR